MKLSTQPYKGARDFYPEDLSIRKYIFDVIRHVVESYGYEEYDAPLIEPIELYQAKSGSEIVADQTYRFLDKGNREVAIRPEMTPSVSRMVAARRQQLAYPLRWYSIPNLWRYERPQRGRFREHWQLNVDIFGIASIAAELELIQITDHILRAFGGKPTMFRIKINHRQLLNLLFTDYLRLNPMQSIAMASLIDRSQKMVRSEFIEQIDKILTADQKRKSTTEKLLNVINSDSLDKLPPLLKNSEPAKQLRQLIEACSELSIGNVDFSLSIVRGFDYYSGLVFELFDASVENSRSMLGGGRYDGLVGLFGVENVPTAGFGLGDATLINFLKLHGLLPDVESLTQIYIVIIGELILEAMKIANMLRRAGLKVAVDLSSKKLGEQIKTAAKKGIRYVLIIGEHEIKSQQYTFRDLIASNEVKLSLEKIEKLVKASTLK
ncbi:histidine--tRNA ligase [Patescibacteria group bacterium]|nr:histidine--tRNA ligase [Patescibacteria group bacterium]